MQKRLRILHVVGGMHTGGVETWLMHVLRGIDRNRFYFDFLINVSKPCFYDDEILSLGSRIITLPHEKKPFQYGVNFIRLLRKNGPYDIVHSHVHHYSGYILLLSRIAGVRIRIAHSHNNTESIEIKSNHLRRLYLRCSKLLIQTNATAGLACSHPAAADLFGVDWERNVRWQILPCGIDFTPFSHPVDRIEMRRKFMIPEDALVIGHVGRFASQKNHEFLIDVLKEVSRLEPSARLLLIGDGPLYTVIKTKVKNLNLTDKVIFMGVRADIPVLMRALMDVFVFPSLYEGLGLVLVEAQAASLPCVLSDAIPADAYIVPELLHVLSLEDHPKLWAEELVKHCARNQTHVDPLSSLLQTNFNINNCLPLLERIYSC